MTFSLPPDTPKGQLEAITADDKLITVGAGAGTGKTWVLSNRYARILVDGEKILPSNILTLTFTEPAAEEMKVRIIDRIKSELVNLDDAGRRQKILDGLSDIWISTIHGFAMKLIRESGLSLDIDPTASVINAQQEQEFWEGIKNAADFANLKELARTYGDKTLQEAAKFLDKDLYMSSAINRWGAEKLSTLAKQAADLHSSSGHSYMDMMSWSENDDLIAKTLPSIQNILAYEWREVWNIFSDITLPQASNPEGPGGVLNDLLERQKLNSPDDIEALKHFYKRLVIDKDIRSNAYEPFKTLKQILGMTLGDWRNTRPKLLKKLTVNIDAEISPAELQMRKTLLKFCALSWGMWDMMKKRRGLLSFSDMILHARSAIDNKSVRREFNHVLVDEFQDTDKLQFDMIEALAKNFDDTSIFAVGDPQQSIYKFRHADPSLFAGVMNRADRKIALNVSFRTRDALLTQINGIFSSLWRGGLGKSDPAMSELGYNMLYTPSQNGERDSGTMPVFEIFLSRVEGRSNKNAKKNLAEELAFNIYNWIREGRTIWDKAEKIIRPVRFSDFAILTRSRIIYDEIEAALEKFNIPSIPDKSEEFFTRGEIGDVVCMLRAAADFDDSFSVAGWLMSPFSGVTEDDAVKCLSLVNKNNKIIDIMKENLPDAYSRLEYLSVIGENEGPAGILSIFNKDRKWLSCYKDDNDRLRVLRNFQKALSLSRAFQQSGTSSLTACAQWLTRAVKSGIKLEEPVWHEDNENAVKLCSVHSAKGLEYPVTIIFEGRSKKKNETNSLRPSRELGLAFSRLPDELESEIEPLCSDFDKILVEQGDLEEETRLFYVAATRAQDSLIFCGLVQAENDEPYNDTWTKFLLDNIDREKFNITFADGVEISSSYEKINDEEKILTPKEIIKTKNYLRQISASSFSLFEWCPFAWRRRYRRGRALTWEHTDRDFEAQIEAGNFIGGAALGSLAHWILARWPKNEDYESELEYYLDDREMISKLPVFLRDVWRGRNSRDALKIWLMRFAESDLGKILRTQKNIRREERFTVRLNKNISLAGAIDALYENNLIDYKITSINDAPPGLYEAQLDFYALVAHELTGNDEIKITTAFLREGVFSERICNNFDGIRERILNASEICASGNLPPKREHCRLCPYKKGCAFKEDKAE